MYQKITLDPFIKSILATCYPAYRGRKVKLHEQSYPMDVRSYWDSVSRSYYVFYSLLTGSTVAMPTQSGFDPQTAGSKDVTLPDGIICVEHSIFMGKNAGITIHVNPANVVNMLPAPVAA